MRLGLLGPAHGDLVAVAEAAHVLLDRARAERIVYLGADDALDRVVSAWARELVGANPSEDVMFERAARACVRASSSAIEAFVGSERARRRLRILTTVPPPPGRTIELFDGRVAVIVWDKGMLDEDDIAGATLLVFGKSATALFHRVGSRMFFSPGPLVGAAQAGALSPEARKDGVGIAVVDDEGGVRLELLDYEGKVLRAERLEAGRVAGAKLRIQ